MRGLAMTTPQPLHRPRAPARPSVTIDGDLLERARTECSRSGRLQAQTLRSLGRSAVLHAELRRHHPRPPGIVPKLRHRLHSEEDKVRRLEEALVTNRRIGMAVGILMRALPATEEQAFEVLRQVSMQSNVKLRDVAERVIYTGTV